MSMNNDLCGKKVSITWKEKSNDYATEFKVVEVDTASGFIKLDDPQYDNNIWWHALSDIESIQETE
jgi:hypothetical protein